MKNLSIIIPHYNTPVLLEKLLNTIPQNKEIEVIVVDDRTDRGIEKYKELVRSEKYSHITFLDNNTGKKGAGAARNIGLEKATGKWLLFADADDYFIDDFFEQVKKYFNTDHDVVFFKMTSCYLDTDEKAERHVLYDRLLNDYLHLKEMKSEMALRYLFNSPCGKLLKGQFVIAEGIVFDEVIAANDVMFSARVGHHMKSFAIDESVIYTITRGSGTLTTNASEHIFDTRLEVFINYHHYLKEKLTEEQFRALDLSGRSMVLNVFKYRLGFKKLIKVIHILRQKNIKIMRLDMLSPFVTGRIIINFAKRYNEEKKYMKRG